MAARGRQKKLTATEAADALGMTKQAVGQWANQAPADTWVLDNGDRLLLWPQFPVWYRQHLQKNREKPEDFEAARTRKMAAEAEIAEYELAQLRGSMVPDAVLDQVLGERLDRVRALLQTLPGRGAVRTVGLKALQESQAVWESLVTEIMGELSHGDGRRR